VRRRRGTFTHANATDREVIVGEARDVGAKFVDAFNAHDESRIRNLNADNTALEAPGDIRLQGKEAATQYAMAWLNAFPDSRMTVNNELESGDWIVQEITFEGTHQGTLSTPTGDVPPTNRRLTGRATQIVRVEGGKVVDTRLYFDQVQVLTQLGLMPEAATA
jgi:predicted ester cyclase